MHLSNKILLGVIAVVSLAFVVFGAAVLNKQNQLRSNLNRIERDLAATQKRNQELRHGSPAQPGVQQLRGDLDHVTVARGKVWYNVAPQADPATGVTTATIEAPVPHQIAAGKVLYAFANRDEGGGYLAEFRATGANDKQVTLTPVAKLTASELERLTKAPVPWTLYDTMPADSHTVFAETPEEELTKLLPESVLTEYQRDGKPADPNDPPERVLDGNYNRQMRDYVASFKEFNRLRSVYLDRIAAEQKDQEYLKGALAEANDTVNFRKQQVEDTNNQIARATAERDAVLAHRQALETQLAQTQESIAKLGQENDRLAASLAKFQMEAVRRVNQRTAAAGASR
jgi:hypothetical protein